MKVLMIGDIVANPGLVVLKKILEKIGSGYDYIIANAENSAPNQKGITVESAKAMLTAGCNILTSGNHYQTRPSIWPKVKELNLIRPANYTPPGQGYYTDGVVTVINLAGIAMMPPIETTSYLEKIESILTKPNLGKIKIIDFHAMTNYEKKALGYHLGGRVSLIVGTHSHTPTADQQIINNYTGFVSDLGMSGALNSILGYDIGKALEIKQGLFSPSSPAKDDGCYVFNSVEAEIDDKTGQTLQIRRVDYNVINSQIIKVS